MAINKERRLIKTTVNWRPIILASSITLAIGLIAVHNFSRNWLTLPVKVTQNKTENLSPPHPVKVAITALGRLQPQGEIRYLSAPNSINGVRVEKLLVQEGDKVKTGQVLAYLENYVRATTAVQQSLDKLQIAKARLAQVSAGAKTGDIQAQKAAIARLQSQLTGEVTAQQATINRIQAEVDNAAKENQRYQQLYHQGAIAAAIADTKALQLKTLQQQLTEAQASLNRTQNTLKEQIIEAQARLNSIAEVRAVDVELAQTEVKSAETAIKQAKADQELTYLTSPIDGKVLKIHAQTGEVIGTTGFAEIGNISQMYVIAEVHQTDVQKVKIGQKANITSTAFPGIIPGTVKKIGSQVERQSIFSLNPSTDTDRRIVEVEISIDQPADSQRVAGFTNLQVDVAIQI